MAALKAHKVVSALPGTLEANCLYLVRTGAGFDLYATNDSGTVVAYPLNGGAGGGGTAPVTGKTIIDFGAGASIAAVAVTGQTGIVSGSIVQAWLMPMATLDHSVDEHLAEGIDVFAGAIDAGMGFTIWARTRTSRLSGLWTVAWSWI